MMIKKLSIRPPDEEDIEGQIDRLNLAVQHIMQGIELSAQTPRNPSQLSLSYRAWGDDDIEDNNSVEEGLPLEFEQKLEEILLQLDRSQMVVEDFWSEAQKKENNPKDSENEAYILKLEKENMELRSKTISTRHSFSLNLKKNPQLDNEKRNFEDKLQELDKLNESYHTKQRQILKIQESLKVKEKWIDSKEKELRSCWQNFEKTKQEWENSKTHKFSEREIPLGLKYNKPSLQSSIYSPNPEAPPPIIPQTPSSRQRSLELAQEELKSLESKLEGTTDPDSSKLIMRIDQLKNKIATLRGQKALYESNRSSRLISGMMKTMEKQVSYEEHKRKHALEKFTKKSMNEKKEENAKGFPMNLEAVRRFSFIEGSTPRNSTVNKGQATPRMHEDKQTLALIKENLVKREKELQQRELLLQETWMKLPGSKELIEIVNLTLAKLKEQKDELDDEREKFENEKVDLFKLRDKVVDQMNKLNNNI